MKRSLHYVVLSFILFSLCAFAADKGDLSKEVQYTIEQLKKQDSSIKTFFEKSHGYAIFPRVGKGGFGIGGAHGRGQVYKKDVLIGTTSLSQVTIGFQLGGQVYSEVIFFEDQKALDSFKDNKFALSAQAGAVAAAEGASANAKFELGVAIFTMARGGLMYEASVGGQKFSFKPQ
jgi:lipid-binding SYLF domain-containing protein